MKLSEIAKRGLRGRKKDTWLLKTVVTLAFIFIITSTIFHSSIENTKLKQRLDLYGKWHAAYLQGDDEVLNRLRKEEAIDSIGLSTIIGKSTNAGIVGTFNEELLDMGNFKLYAGRFPQSKGEIMVELNQISNMGLELEVGQKVKLEIVVFERYLDLKDYVEALKDRYHADTIRENLPDTPYLPSYTNNLLKDNLYHSVSFENVGDVLVVTTDDYIHVTPIASYISPEMIMEEGAMYYNKLVLKKEFTISGIIYSYSDKWDCNGFPLANSFITEEAGKELINAIYNTSLGDYSFHRIKHNIFLSSNSLKDGLYSHFKTKYPHMEGEERKDKRVLEDVYNFIHKFGKTEEELEKTPKAGRLDDLYRHENNLEEDLSHIKVEPNLSNFRRNNFSYPEFTGSTENILAITIIAVIFIATALAVFQIFLTQIRRRARKLALLKSIGATNWQLIKILLYEGIYILRSGIIMGIPIGVALAFLLVLSMNTFMARGIQFHINPWLMGLGIVAVSLAFFVAMAFPVIYAINIPLVGTISKPPKHKKKVIVGKGVAIKKQTFTSINFTYFKQNGARSLISLGLSLVTISISLSTLLVCYLAFGSYRDMVIAKNRPDYAMETYYGENRMKLPQVKEEIMSIEGIREAEAYKVGRNTLLYYEGMEDNILIEEFKELLPDTLYNRHFKAFHNKILNKEVTGLYTRYYGLDPESELFQRFSSQITLGQLNKEEFIQGNEVILLTPMYWELDPKEINSTIEEDQLVASTSDDDRFAWLLNQSNRYLLSYNRTFAKHFNRLDDLKPGDSIYLAADEEKMKNESRVLSYITTEVKVGGIIYYFPEEGIWPFSARTTPYIVVGSYEGMEKLYPNSRLGLFNRSLEVMKIMTDTQFPNKYGRTLWYLNTDSKIIDYVLDAKLLSFANNNGYTLYNYKTSNMQLYHEAVNNTIIIALLGLTAASIASVILYNTNISKLEQDKNRIGILQALGVTKEDFTKLYLKIGLLVGLVNILLSHILIFLVLFITSIASVGFLDMDLTSYINYLLTDSLWLYPWSIHIFLCFLYLGLTILIYYLPSRKIISPYPVDNIRSLSRL